MNQATGSAQQESKTIASLDKLVTNILEIQTQTCELEHLLDIALSPVEPPSDCANLSKIQEDQSSFLENKIQNCIDQSESAIGNIIKLKSRIRL